MQSSKWKTSDCSHFKNSPLTRRACSLFFLNSESMTISKLSMTISKFVLRVAIVNCKYNLAVLEHLRNDIRRKCSKKYVKYFCLYHDNVPCHIWLLIRQFPAGTKITVYPHSHLTYTLLTGLTQTGCSAVPSIDFLLRKKHVEAFFVHFWLSRQLRIISVTEDITKERVLMKTTKQLSICRKKKIF